MCLIIRWFLLIYILLVNESIIFHGLSSNFSWFCILTYITHRIPDLLFLFLEQSNDIPPPMMIMTIPPLTIPFIVPRECSFSSLTLSSLAVGLRLCSAYIIKFHALCSYIL